MHQGNMAKWNSQHMHDEAEDQGNVSCGQVQASKSVETKNY